MRPELFCTAAAAVILWAGAAAAQPARTPDAAGAEAANALRGVVVTASRAPSAQTGVAQAITVLDRAEIEASQAILLPDLLIRTPGVTLSRNGGPGGVTALRIRGAESDQTVVVIDGVKLTDAAAPGGGYNFANLLTGDAARVEVLRGAQSTLWGSQAIGGVIHVVSTAPTETLQGDLTAEAGGDRTAYVRGGLGGRTERLLWRLGAGYYTTDGVSAYERGAEDDGFQHTLVNGRLEYALADGVALDLRGAWSYGRVQVDGFPAPAFTFADTAEYGVTDERIGYAGLKVDLLDGRLRNRLAISRTEVERESVDPLRAVSTTFQSEAETDRYEYQGAFAITEAWQAVFGLEREETAIATASPSAFAPNPVPQTAAARLDSAYLQVQGEVWPGLSLTAGLRGDDHQTFGGKALGQLALAWTPNAGATVLRASFGQGFKAPSLYQLYSEYGNLGLEPETADAWDVGVSQQLLGGAATVSATWFQRETTNQIDYVSCFSAPGDPLCVILGGGTRFGYYANVARTEAHGVELEGEARTGPFRFQANYTWTDARNEAAGSPNRGNQLARRPEHQGYVAATWEAASGGSATLAVRHLGAAFDNAANTSRLQARTLVDLRAAWPLAESVEGFGRVENLFDDRAPSTAGYGEVGRAAFVGVRARF